VKGVAGFAYLVAAAVVAGALGACGGGSDQGAGGTQPDTTTKPVVTTEGETTNASGTDGASCPGESVSVSAQANIYGAGLDFAPGPGGGGGGELPPAQALPQEASAVTFPKVTGEVSPRLVNGAGRYHGPQGDPDGETDIDSYGGISGIVDRRHGMFLVGVFLTDDPPSTTAPERLDFTKHERFRSLAPQVAQTFFIGAGGSRAFEIPPGATRLFLGFADAFSGTTYYQGHPGYYDNNGGHLCVAVKVT
jgi:hypothetical protein